MFVLAIYKGSSGRAMVLGNMQCGGFVSLDSNRTRAYCASSRCGGGGGRLFDNFFSRLSFFLFFLSLCCIRLDRD